MLFIWLDHPLIEGWREARLRAELHREDPALANDRPLERLKVAVIEALQISRVNRSSEGRSIRSTPMHHAATMTGGAGEGDVTTSGPG